MADRVNFILWETVGLDKMRKESIGPEPSTEKTSYGEKIYFTTNCHDGAVQHDPVCHTFGAGF
jgi:hypothetical protein